MNDLSRSFLGVLGTIAGITLDQFAQGAGIAASVATAFYMGFCALEKWEARRARLREAAQMRLPFLDTK